MTFREARLTLQLMAEEEIGAPTEAELKMKRAIEDRAWDAMKA